MFRRLVEFVLHWLRVPPEPQPPHGDPASLRVFRAGRNHLNLRLVRWSAAQLVALAGIVFWVGVFIDVELEVHARRNAHEAPEAFKNIRNFDDFVKRIGAGETEAKAAAAKAPETKAGEAKAAGAANADPKAAKAAEPQKKKMRVRIDGWAGFKRMLVDVALRLPPWVFPLLWTLKVFGIVAYLVQLPVTYAIVRLDFELRWYMVTDRSLRIRSGVWKINESTMSFANIQQVEVSQGPLQRLLGLADVTVQSAGGASIEKEHKGDDDDMHVGRFHSVTNASEIRDLILARLRRFRQAGLGDPDDHHAPVAVTPPTAVGAEAAAGGPGSAGAEAAPQMAETLAAAQELLAEARALREVMRG